MKKKLLVALVLSGALALTGGLAGCKNGDDDKDQDKPGIEDPDNPNPENPDDPKVHTAPVITVNPKEMEIYAGEEIDLLFGVSAVDDEGNKVNVTIKDSNDIDESNPEEGVYTITYEATAFELTSTATRKITVLKELAPITLQARTEWEKPGKWEKGSTINFKHSNYYEVDEDTDFPEESAKRISGVWHNTSDHEIVVSVGAKGSGGGCTAILDAHGVLVEGRDGANGKLINAENPLRATSSASKFTYNDEEYTVANNHAQKMRIPAGGFAIVVQSSYLGTDADSDGRAFMNYNVINEYGNVFRLYWSDAEEGEYLTEYVNQAPTVSGLTDVFVVPGDKNFDLAKAVKDGVKVSDDNGTFDMADDVTLPADSIQVLNADEFDIDTEGDYIIRLSVSDGKLTTEFTRKVKVVGEEYVTKVELASGDVVTVLKTNVAVDQDLTKIGTNAFIIYTYDYKSEHAELGFSNGYGTAYIIDRYGKIARVYDGANGRYSDATVKDKTGVVNSSLYAKQAYDSLQEGEIVVIAPHDGGANSAPGGSRNIFMQLRNRTAIGTDFKITGFTFEEKPFVLTVGDKSISAVESKYAYNVAVEDTTKTDMAVYTKEFGATNPCAGWSQGWAAVVDKFGELIKIYDGVNGKVYDAAHRDGQTGVITADNYAEVAYTSLGDGERLIVFLSNAGKATAAELIEFIGTDVTLTDVTFAERTVEFGVGDDKLEIPLSEYSLNGETADNAKVEMYKGYEGADPSFTGYDKGVAVVINDFGEILGVIDGINGKLYNDGDEIPFDSIDGMTGKNYAQIAFMMWKGGADSDDGKNAILLLFKGETGDHVTYALALKDKIGEVVTFTDINFKQRGIIFTIKNKSFYVAPQYYLEDEKATAPANYQVLVYHSDYEETDFGKGWGYGAALVVDGEGRLVRIYDGANGGIWENEKLTPPEGFATNKYAEFAYAYAKENGYTLIVFPNSTVGSGNPARAFALGLRPVNGVGTGAIGEVLTIEDTRKA